MSAIVGPGWAPAKVNLALHVVGQRNDGYHLIESLVVFTRFGDRVAARHAEANEFHVTGPYAQMIPTDGNNLVLRARNALRGTLIPTDRKHSLSAAHDDTAGAAFPVSILLEKNMPPASGIGGGSSDAAATLRELARHWGMEDETPLDGIALSLGADVPMCLSPHPALVSGIGEKVERLSLFPPLFIVLVNPGVEVSTPAVFSRLTKKNNPGFWRPALGDRETLYAWLDDTRNDLQAPALELAPPVGDALAALRATRARCARMSGSGATCFGLYDTKAEAEAAAAGIRRARPGWFVAATETFASTGEDHAGN
jgi:4-diphosphocytidyl-2-C-methyl-D-erythritol kinase